MINHYQILLLLVPSFSAFCLRSKLGKMASTIKAATKRAPVISW